jgi:hypothetical protein
MLPLATFHPPHVMQSAICACTRRGTRPGGPVTYSVTMRPAVELVTVTELKRPYRRHPAACPVLIPHVSPFVYPGFWVNNRCSSPPHCAPAQTATDRQTGSKGHATHDQTWRAGTISGSSAILRYFQSAPRPSPKDGRKNRRNSYEFSRTVTPWHIFRRCVNFPAIADSAHAGVE